MPYWPIINMLATMQHFNTALLSSRGVQILRDSKTSARDTTLLIPCTPVTESREYGNPIPSQNASLSNNYNITSAVHNCMCAFQFARGRYARTLRTADMLTLFCKLRKTKNFWRNSFKILGLPNARQKSYLCAQNQTRAYTRQKTHVRFESAAALFNVKCS